MKKVLLKLLAVVLALSLILPSTAFLSNTVTYDDVSYRTGQEVTQLRTQYSRTYVGDNGSLAASIYIQSINYQSQDGSFKPIDTDIRSCKNPHWDWQVTDGHWHLYIKNDTTTFTRKGSFQSSFRLDAVAYYDVSTDTYAIIQHTYPSEPTVSNNTIQWTDIMYGIDYRITYTPDQLKEDIILTQRAREYYEVNNTPQDYGLNPESTHLVFLFESDWNQRSHAKLQSNKHLKLDDAAFTDDILFGLEETDKYFDTNYSVSIPQRDAVSANPINPYADKENWIYDSTPITTRLFSDNDDTWMSIGSDLSVINKMPVGDIIFDPTETLRPNGVGNTTGLTIHAPDTGEANWEDVDEAVPDDLTTCLRTASDDTVWQYDTYTFPNSAIAAGVNVNHLTVHWKWRTTANAAKESFTKPYIRSGGTDYDGTEISYFENAVWHIESQQYVQNPDTTAAWTIAGIDAAEFGIGLKSDTDTFHVFVTQVYIEIDYDALPEVTSAAATNVEETLATLNGEITNVGNDVSCDERGFVYDTATHGDPGDVAPGASGYASSWADAGGPWGTGVFDSGANVTGLTKGELYYYRAYAHNSDGYDYSDTEQTFLTKPDPPFNLAATASAVETITLDWTKGTGAQNTYIRGEDGSYPTDRADGYLVYNNNGVTVDDAGLTGDHTYYYRAWSYATEGGKEQYSDSYDEDNALAYALPSVTTNAAEDIGREIATFSGNITATGSGSCDFRGFVYDLATQGDPGNTDPALCAYANNVSEGGVFGIANYTHAESGLTEGTPYYVRAWAHNAYGWAYGGEITFTTLDLVIWFQPNNIITNTGETSTADAGSTDVKIIDAALTQADDYWNGARLIIVTTTDTFAPQGETAIITDFLQATDELQFAALTAAVDAGDTFTIDFGTITNRAGANDGRITWGVNPASAATSLGGMVSIGQPGVGTTEEDVPGSVLTVTETTDWFGDGTVGGTILTNPVRPFITMLSDNTTLSEILAWRLMGVALLLFITLAASRVLRQHQGITVIVAAAVLCGLVALDHNIFPLWMLVLAVGMFVGGLISERSPSL